jgi:hypothetical protein
MKKLISLFLLAGAFACGGVEGLEENTSLATARSRDLSVTFSGQHGTSTWRALTATRCPRTGSCVTLDLNVFTIEESDPAANTVEVCHETNPWKDVCDVYDCYYTANSCVCDYQYTYNKDCYTDGCSG